MDVSVTLRSDLAPTLQLAWDPTASAWPCSSSVALECDPTACAPRAEGRRGRPPAASVQHPPAAATAPCGRRHAVAADACHRAAHSAGAGGTRHLRIPPCMHACMHVG
eukprot:356137-Chlamydomonas_euryale.AAC.1